MKGCCHLYSLDDFKEFFHCVQYFLLYVNFLHRGRMTITCLSVPHYRGSPLTSFGEFNV